ncbi:MAG: hypothetical protein ACK4ND_17175 [Cytophagaceae bacterium]
MNLVIQVLILFLLGIILYQDFKYRAVVWIIFPLLALLFMALHLTNSSGEIFIENSLLNVGFLFLQVVMLTMYFSIKAGKVVWIADTYLGWGDICFMLCICMFFPPLNYIIFFIASLLFALPVYAVLKAMYGKKVATVPLAGIQAGFLALWIIFYQSFENYNPANDAWLLELL